MEQRTTLPAHVSHVFLTAQYSILKQRQVVERGKGGEIINILRRTRRAASLAPVEYRNSFSIAKSLPSLFYCKMSAFLK